MVPDMNPNLRYCNKILIQEGNSGNLKPPLPFVNLVFVFEKKIQSVWQASIWHKIAWQLYRLGRKLFITIDYVQVFIINSGAIVGYAVLPGFCPD